MNPQAKKLAMFSLTSAAKVVQTVGYAKAAAFTGVYFAAIRQADRERLGKMNGVTVINNIHVHNSTSSIHAVQNRNSLGRDL